MFWKKKEVSEQIDLETTVVSFTTERETYNKTFGGYIQTFLSPNDCITTGKQEAVEFLNKNHSFIKCDNGEWIPTYIIKKVTLKTTSNIVLI